MEFSFCLICIDDFFYFEYFIGIVSLVYIYEVFFLMLVLLGLVFFVMLEFRLIILVDVGVIEEICFVEVGWDCLGLNLLIFVRWRVGNRVFVFG